MKFIDFLLRKFLCMIPFCLFISFILLIISIFPLVWHPKVNSSNINKLQKRGEDLILRSNDKQQLKEIKIYSHYALFFILSVKFFLSVICFIILTNFILIAIYVGNFKNISNLYKYLSQYSNLTRTTYLGLFILCFKSFIVDLLKWLVTVLPLGKNPDKGLATILKILINKTNYFKYLKDVKIRFKELGKWKSDTHVFQPRTKT